MLLSLFPSLSEKEGIALWCCCAALWLIWVLSDYFGKSARGGKKGDVTGLQLQVSKTVFVREVIRWCVEHLGLPPRSKAWPQVVLRYYRHQKLMGSYLHYGKVITLYWGSHSALADIVNTLIHEYQHFLDIRENQDSKAYDKETASVGYIKNPYEQRARQVADRSEKACLQEMIRKGLVK